MLKWLAVFANWSSRVCSAIAAGLTIILALMIGLGAVSRYLIAKPVPAVDELGAFMLVAIIFLGAGYLLQRDGHVKVDIVTKMLPRRWSAWLVVFTDTISILGTLMLVIVTARVAVLSIAVGNRTIGLLEIPIGAVQLIIPIGLSVLILQFFRVLSSSLKSAVCPPEIQK